jgi:cytochrome c peroxidase
MHDGRFATLDDVLNHYSHGIQASANLDNKLRDQSGAPKHFDISDSERKAIIEFLKTLTDYDMISDPKFSNPFRPK